MNSTTPTTLQPPSSQAKQSPIAARTIAATRIFGEGDVRVVALDNVDIGFESGQFTAVMGPSGSGKSTLMHCMAGLDRLTSGAAYLGDIDLGSLSEKQLTEVRRDQIGFVFQAFNLVPTLTAKENILLPLTLAGHKPDSDWVDNVVQTVGLKARLSHRPSELSGGQQQRVAVARALASKPQMIFADEPTGNLDRSSAAEVLGLLRRATRESGQSIAMVTHDPVAASFADRAIFLADGRVAANLSSPNVDTVLAAMRSLEA